MPALTMAVALLLCGCGDSTESIVPAARVAELSGPYLAEPYRAFDQALLARVDEECAASNPGDRLELVLVDGRGGGRLLLVYDGANGASAECFTTIETNGDVFLESTGTSSDGGANLPGPLEVRPMSGGSSSGPNAWSYLHGRVGSDISRIELELPNGDRITASSSGGRFAGWWPGEQMSVRILGYDAAGNQVYDEPF
jgi:hypothetical protein